MSESPSTPDLTGTSALITGATSGLGLAMATALAAAGARVAITGRSQKRAAEAAALLPGAIGVEMDVRDETSVASAVTTAWSAFDGIDLLVNNAGIGMETVNPDFLTEPAAFWRIPVSGFRDIVDTNLTGYFLAAREVAPRMLAAGHGRIVNIAVSPAITSRAGFVPYGPSRAASESLSRIMSADLRETPIRVNLLMPGGTTRTGMLPAGAVPPPGVTFLEPSVMGEPIVWLASEAASDVHDERISAVDFRAWLGMREA